MLINCFHFTSYTFYLLRTTLNKRRSSLLTLLQNFVVFTAARQPIQAAAADESDAVVPTDLDNDIKVEPTTGPPPILCSIIELLLNLTEPSPLRSLTVTPNDLAAILSWTTTSDTEIETDKFHPLRSLRAAYETAPQFEAIFRKLSEASSFVEMTDISEPSFGQADGIVQQFAARPVFVLVDDYIEVEHADYWADTADVDADATSAGVLCDLTELIKTCLPNDVNVTGECKRLLHLSASPQSNRERTTTAPCFRTRRVEVEPATGRPEKKIYGKPTVFINRKKN